MYKSASFIILAAITVIIYAQDEFQPRQDHSVQLRQAPAVNSSCTQESDCGDHGTCRNNKCQCHEGYITWKRSGTCNYKQAPKLMAFVVSLIVGGLGVDWFVLAKDNSGYIAAGIFKLLLPCLPAIGIPCIAVARKNDSTVLAMIAYIINSVTGIAVLIWWLVDWIRILTDKFPDGNGAPLKPW